MQPNHLYYGDCLDWMREWDDECVDLIYLDPPFNSAAKYNVLFADEPAGGKAQYRAFNDTWHWDDAAVERYEAFENALARPARDTIVGLRQILGKSGMLAYLTYMAERLIEMRRLLKPTGALYLHCDPTASHYLKIVMDAIFGRINYRSEIVWKRTSSHNRAKRWGPIHDVIHFYSVSNRYTWNRVLQPLDRDYIEKNYRHQDSKGVYRISDLTGPGERKGDTGLPWRGVDPTDSGRHWEPPPDRALPDWFVFPDGYSDISPRERLDILDAQGLIYWPKKKGGIPGFKRYLGSGSGVAVQDIVADVKPLSAAESENLGYPTQKPLALLERIIKASSNEGDIVLDPFCGCGTSIDAARRLNRQWAGIDISSFAIDLIRKERFKNENIPAKGIPRDMASARKLAREKPFDFESWAVMRLPGFAPNMKQTGDSGVDGRAALAHVPDSSESRLALAQVKGGRFSLSHLRDFSGVMERDQAALGYYITLDPVETRAARAEAREKGTIAVLGTEYERLQLWSIQDYFERRLPSLPQMLNPYTGKEQDKTIALF